MSGAQSWMMRVVWVAAIALCVAGPSACGRAMPVAFTSPAASATPAAESPSPSASPMVPFSGISQPGTPIPLGQRPRPLPAPVCPAFALQSFKVGPATTNAYREATIYWSTSGGCAPFQGDIGATSFVPPVSTQVPIHSASGSVVVTLPFGTACTPPTSANVTFYMVLSDGAGHSITPDQTRTMTPVAIC